MRKAVGMALDEADLDRRVLLLPPGWSPSSVIADVLNVQVRDLKVLVQRCYLEVQHVGSSVGNTTTGIGANDWYRPSPQLRELWAVHQGDPVVLDAVQRILSMDMPA